MLAWWLLGGVLLYYSQAVSTDGLYATQADLDKAAAGMGSNAAFIAMAGPARALDTVGGQVAWQAAAFGAVIAGLMSMFLIGRHTRAEEESGRDELVRAAVVGRHAPLAAAALVMLIANAVLGSLITGSLVSYGLPFRGSLALGLAAGLAGLVFGAVMLAAAQLAASVRVAYGITGATIALAYVLRAIGDVGDGTLSWLSPIGWGQYMRAYADETWWPALLSVGAAAAVTAAAVVLFERRDIGSGVLPARPGPAHGALGSTLALAWRLQRGSVIGWTTGSFVMGAAYGSIGSDVGDLIGDSQFSQEVFTHGGGSLVDSFYATLVALLALTTCGFAVSSVLRLRGEEQQHFAELLLSTRLSRRRWATSHLLVTTGGAVAVLLGAGAGIGISFALVTHDPAAAGRLLGATMQYAAPVAVVSAATWLAYGMRSRWGVAGWAAVGFCAIVMLFGEVLRLPGWLLGMSPFQHLALLPAEPVRVLPLVVLLGLSVLTGIAGMRALTHRDVG